MPRASTTKRPSLPLRSWSLAFLAEALLGECAMAMPPATAAPRTHTNPIVRRVLRFMLDSLGTIGGHPRRRLMRQDPSEAQCDLIRRLRPARRARSARRRDRAGPSARAGA